MAKKASKHLGIEFKTKNNFPSEGLGLDNKDSCDCGEIHGYLPRGRFDDGEYLTIEYTDYFPNFTNGYYIVVAASGPKDSLTATLIKAQKFYKTAYIKTDSVFVGCMH